MPRAGGEASVDAQCATFASPSPCASVLLTQPHIVVMRVDVVLMRQPAVDIVPGYPDAVADNERHCRQLRFHSLHSLAVLRNLRRIGQIRLEGEIRRVDQQSVLQRMKHWVVPCGRHQIDLGDVEVVALAQGAAYDGFVLR